MKKSIPFEVYLLRKYLSERAVYCITQNIQDQANRYEIKIDPLIKDPSFHLDENNNFPLNVLPIGSRWSPVLNWHSFFGIPFEIEGQEILILGIHLVMPNPFGGAFPYTEAYVYKFDYSMPLAGMSRLLNELSPTLNSSIYANGVVRSTNTTLDNYHSVEGKIIQSALASYSDALEEKYRKEPLLYFQSLILSEDQLKKPGLPGPNWWRNRSGYLLGVRSQLVSDFSWQTKISLFMCQTS